MTKRILIGLLLYGVLLSHAFATQYYVATTGSGTTCSLGSPCVTIQVVVANHALVAGDGVNVAAGTYTGGIATTANGSAGNLITYQCTVRWSCKIVPVVNGSTTYAWQNGGGSSGTEGNYVVIDGFEVDGSNYRGGTHWTDGIDDGGTNGVLSHNLVHHILQNAACNVSGGAGMSMDAFWGGGSGMTANANVIHDIGPLACPNLIHGLYVMAANDVVTNNVVYNTAGNCITSWHNADASTITNNTVFNCAGGGISTGTGQWYAAAGSSEPNFVTNATTTASTVLHTAATNGVIAGQGVYCSGCGFGYNPIASVVANTTVTLTNAVTVGSGVTVYFGTISHNNVLANNITMNNPGASGYPLEAQGAYQATTLTVANNLENGNAQADFWGGCGGANCVPTVTGLVTTAPTFINGAMAGGGDYHEASGSSSRAAGTATNAPVTDFDGNARPGVASAYDIGAYQYLSPPIYPTTSPQYIAGSAAVLADSLNVTGYPAGFDFGACIQLTNPNASTVGGGAGTTQLTPKRKFICVDQNGDLAFYSDNWTRLLKLFDTGSMVIGSQANPHGNLGATCQSNIGLPATAGAGIVQTCRYTFAQTATAATAVRLTADANAAGINNCANMPPNSSGTYTVQLIASDITTRGKDIEWTMPNGGFIEDATASTFALTNGTPTSVTLRGTVTGSSVSLTSDTTNGCFNLSFTPPTSNTDTWNIGAYIDIIESPPQ